MHDTADLFHFFLPGIVPGIVENHRELFNGCKSHHLQMPYPTDIDIFGTISQVPGLTGCQNIIERYLIAHIKYIAHIYMLSMNSTI